MEEVLVSVIIPTYRRPVSLRRAVASALDQTLRQIEVIVVDDNEPHSELRASTIDVVESFADQRVRHLLMPAHQNASAARNAGITIARGEMIAFLDDDDWFEPSKLEKQYHVLQNNACFDAVYCGAMIKEKTVIPTWQGAPVYELLLMKTSMFTPTLMFRKQAILDIQGFDNRFDRYQDYELLMRFFRKYQIGVVPEPLVHVGTNKGENLLAAKELEKCKDLFFSSFGADITQFGVAYYRKVYSVHYSPLLYDIYDRANFLIRRGYC